ncbi:MAG: GAF domain-containing protein [Desulfuromonadales bacterium]|nr:GAF domain-containing protein [Desulfuromonadales bacterium]
MRAAETITGSNRSRVYLEDLTSGSLICAVACGLRSDRIPDFAFPLNTDELLISRTYRTQEETAIADTSKLPNASTRDFTQRFAIRASQHFPLIHNGRSIGVLCVDSSRRGQLPNVDQRRQLTTFLGEVAPNIDLARRFHQQLLVARQIDEAKKRKPHW